jgi:hypothetical protein
VPGTERHYFPSMNGDPRRKEVPGEIRPLVEAIRGRFSPESIWLFGSRARGDNRKDSDWDILVALPEGADPRLLDPIVGWSIGREFDVPATVLFTTARDLSESWGSPNTLGYAIAREGRLLVG